MLFITVQFDQLLKQVSKIFHAHKENLQIFVLTKSQVSKRKHAADVLTIN